MSNGTTPPPDPPFEPGDVPHGLTQIGRLGEAVRAEFDLVGMRMTWLVLAEAFIFSAFALSMSNYKAEHKLAEGLLYLIWVMPIVGMMLAACVYAAILAAHAAVSILKEQRDRMMGRLPEHLRICLVSSRSREHWWGNIPPYVIPPLLFLVWAGAFIWLLILSSRGKMA